MARTIIIPLSDPRQDEEGIAEQAINCTHMLLGGGDARVLLLSVIDDEADRGERQAYLDHIAGTIGDDVETVVAFGEPAAQILATAERVDDPLIMMASHGRRGAQLRVLGSVAAAVAAGASCPVMILPASPATEAPICTLIERVLLPINDAAIAEAIIDATIAELGEERAKGIAFYLLDVTPPIPPQPATVEGETFAGASEVPAHFLRRAAELIEARGYRATWELRIGDPTREITRLAAEREINLIVVPAYSRNGFNSLVPSIFAAQVRTEEPVPVLLIHAELDAA
jgi:nucleotide-binding universal stress UspA family protein